MNHSVAAMVRTIHGPAATRTATEKRCAHCRRWQPHAAFPACAEAPDGLQNWCSRCVAADAAPRRADGAVTRSRSKVEPRWIAVLQQIQDQPGATLRQLVPSEASAYGYEWMRETLHHLTDEGLIERTAGSPSYHWRITEAGVTWLEQQKAGKNR